MLGVTEAEQGSCATELVLPDRQRRDPDAAADQQRHASPTRGREADFQRTEDRQLVADSELTQPLGARADVVEHEVQLVGAGGGAQHENARARTAAATLPHPAPGRRQHVELTSQWPRAERIGAAQHVVGAVTLMGDD